MSSTESNRRALGGEVRVRGGALTLFMAVLVLFASVAASVSLADPPAAGSATVLAGSAEETSEAVPIGPQPEKPNALASVPTSQEVAEAIEAGPGAQPVTTDPAAAEGVPRAGLGRGEALGLLEGVFEPELGAPAGIFDELEVEKFLAPNVAVVTQGRSVDSAGQSTDGASEAHAEETDLLDSTIPLRAEAPSGQEEAVDLDLERAEGELRSVNPLVDVELPEELGEGVELPGAGIHIDLVGAPPERSPTIIDGSVAGFPNVAEDTDFAIGPTPTGFETLTQLRTAQAPHAETYKLSLPEGATLAKEGEGAVVTREGKPLLSVAPPTAIDAAGAPVATGLSVSGDLVTVTVSPDESAQLPILVDPVFQTYEWMAKNTEEGFNYYLTEGWGPYEHSEGDVFDWGSNIRSSSLNPPMTYGLRGLYTASISRAAPGSEFFYMYHVPRYYSDPSQHEGREPETFITKMTVSDMGWQAESEKLNPYVYMGLWGPSAGWASLYMHEGLTGHSLNNFGWPYPFANELNVPDVKVAEIGIRSTENVNKAWDYLYVGAATIEMSEPSGTIPKFAEVSGPTGWINQAAVPVNFKVEDAGLGVSSVTVSGEQGSSPPSWKATYSCTGVTGHACPYTWKSSKSIEPASLPQGIDNLKVVAQDPIGHVSTVEKEGKVLDSHVQVKVDHTAPEVFLTGTITEQDSLGTRRASYTLKATAADGNAEHPQSGVAKAEIKLDGKAVALEGKQAEEWAPKCATENCPLAAEWTLNTTGLAEGIHTIEVIATDAVGLSTTKTLTIETRAATAPTLTLSGTMTEQATLGTSRPRYILKAKTSAMAAGFEAPTLGAPAAYLGEVGEEHEKTYSYEPLDVATDSHGNAWVLNARNEPTVQLQEFNEKGEWLRATGGTGYGKLKGPAAVATDSAGNVWVADTGDYRIVEFNERGEFVETFGTGVNKTKVEAAGTEAEKNLCTAASGNVCQAATAGSLPGQLKSPEGIALTSGGNIWVSDQGNNRIEKFNPSGGLLNNLSGEGSEPGKLSRPLGIAVAPDGSIWVADTGNNRIEKWNSSLVFVRTVGSEGWGNGKFVSPYGIDVDSTGAVWVGDGTGRVQEFDESGTYLQTFGAAAGRSGIAAVGLSVDNKGSIWVASPGMHRAYHWMIPGFPVYSSSVGSAGSGNGQFMHLGGLASDGNKGHIWALDQELGRLQEFNEEGKWQRNAGSKGSGAGMLSSPSGLSANNLGNVWVADTGNNRIVEFNEKGEFVETFGTNVNKTKVEAAGTEAEKNLCTAASGNVCQAATAGSAAGQLKAPQGIAVTSTGNLWVADTGNNRLEKFNPSGGLLNNLSGEGTEPGKLKEPAAIAVAPDGSIWVADTGNNRIQAWNSSLTLIHTVGKEGSGGGEFKSPAAIFADASGNIWVGDQKNNRVEEFGEGGRYRGQFGANGSGKFSLSAPMGIAVDNGASIWIADPGHSKIQRWSQETPRSEMTTTIWVDNVQKTTLHGTCKTAGCTIEPSWTQESLALEPGSHTARVKTTDGLGRSTESTLNFQIARDSMKPALEASGELVNAPQGWVEQETYGLEATATDSGSGVTSIQFKIDGKQVASASQSCPDGGCKETLAKQISMASYAGGSHSAELIATDGAGNGFVKHWTINVDPEGHISPAEAEDTLEAADETAESSVVAPTSEVLDQEQREGGDNPGLHQSGSEISSTGVPDTTTMTTNPAEGFTIHSPAGQTTITPTVSEGSSATSIAEGVAGVTADTSHEADLVVRPEFNGVQTFQAIRSVESPEAYSWQVHLAEGQSLRLANSTQAEVVYKDGTLAFLITAEAAHDATGTPVPTSLEVTGSVLTLKVQFRSGNYVYPVIAGQGWETSYRVPVMVDGPEDETQIHEREEREREAREAAEAAGEEPAPPPPSGNAFSPSEAERILKTGAVEEIIPAPAPSGGGGASASSVDVKTVKPFKVCEIDHCSIWHVELKNPSYFYKLNSNKRLTAWWEPETQVHSSWYYNGIYWPELTVDGNGQGFVGPGQVWEGEHKHLTIWGRYTITATVFTPDGGAFGDPNHLALQIWVWPNGYQQRIEKHWDPKIEIVEQ